MIELIAVLLAGIIIGVLIGSFAANGLDKEAVKNGYIKLDGKFYRIEKLPDNAQHE